MKVKTEDQLNYQEILSEVDRVPSIQNYLQAFRLFNDVDLSARNLTRIKLKMAFLSTFTIDPIKPFLFVEGVRASIALDIYLGLYNQAVQDILSNESNLYDFSPDILVLAFQAEKLNPEVGNINGLESELRATLINNIISQIELLVRNFFNKKQNSYILLHNFVIPDYSPLGIMDWKMDFGIKKFYYCLNLEIAKLSRHYANLFIIDIENFASLYGKLQYFDPKFSKLAQMEVNNNLLHLLAREYIRFLKAICGLNKKCLVLDLDNVLWGGIVGEEGLEKIKLGQEPPGNCFLDFQRYILDLFNKGVILAINSKNNYEDAMEVLLKHPDMLLKEKHFAAIKINWQNKPKNMEEIAKELNIGLDSMVFIDDDPAERLLMRQSLPEVTTVEMPDDPALYNRILQQLDLFETTSLTEEDKKRGEYYAQDRKRLELKKTTVNIEEFLKSLDIKITIEKIKASYINRASQLTMRTNQFNLTTRRYSEEDIRRFYQSKDYHIFSLRLKDCFGDSGLCGLSIIKKEKDVCLIDTFLISCRIMGRSVENAFLKKIAEFARTDNISRLRGEIKATAKNKPASDFYSKNNFKKIKNTLSENISIWEYDFKKEIPAIKWIKIDG